MSHEIFCDHCAEEVAVPNDWEHCDCCPACAGSGHTTKREPCRVCEKAIRTTLIARARHHVMTDASRAEQRISWAWGNLAIENPRITREDVERAAKQLDEANGATA